MASIKIDSAVAAAAVAVLFLGALLPSHASTYESAAAYRYVAPAPSPTSYSSPPPPPIQPVVIVQGVIYCKSCKLNGYNRNMDASPLPNATAELVCYGDDNNNYKALNMTSTVTDKNGYFLVMVYEVGTFQSCNCRVYLRSSPTPLCAAPVIPPSMSVGLTVVEEAVESLPDGVRVYRPRSVLMYGPGSGGKCPAY